MSDSSCVICGRVPCGPLRRGRCGRCYEAHRVRQTLYGRWDPDRVPAGPVRDHIVRLKDAGVSYRQIAALSGVYRSVLATVVRGKPGRPPAAWVCAATAAAIAAVPIPSDPCTVAAASDRVPALGAQRRLRALVAFGWPMAHLAEQLGLSATNFGALIHRQQQVSAVRHRQVAALFERLQLEPGPSGRARAYGLRRRWPLPMQWDEESLDDPAATAAAKRRQQRRVA